MKIIIAGLLTVCLVGCVQVQKFTMSDLSNASALAQKYSDSSGEQCWSALVPLIDSATGAQVGAATLIEAKRVFQGLAAGPCASITASAFLDLLALGGKIVFPGF